jgi:hypothetical protein
MPLLKGQYTRSLNKDIMIIMQIIAYIFPLFRPAFTAVFNHNNNMEIHGNQQCVPSWLP